MFRRSSARIPGMSFDKYEGKRDAVINGSVRWTFAGYWW
jgi:hypothetical protein